MNDNLHQRACQVNATLVENVRLIHALIAEEPVRGPLTLEHAGVLGQLEQGAALLGNLLARLADLRGNAQHFADRLRLLPQDTDDWTTNHGKVRQLALAAAPHRPAASGKPKRLEA